MMMIDDDYDYDRDNFDNRYIRKARSAWPPGSLCKR